MALDILGAAREAGNNSGRAVDEHITIAAVNHAFARVRIGGDIIYDPVESVALEGQ